jgi:hypothetical protein
MKIFLFILFIILAVCFSELLCLYLEDSTAYIGGFTLTVFIITNLLNFMERKLAMEWWNNLSYQDKQKILDKYNMIGKPEHLTGREIESIYIKSHKPINV